MDEPPHILLFSETCKVYSDWLKISTKKPLPNTNWKIFTANPHKLWNSQIQRVSSLTLSLSLSLSLSHSLSLSLSLSLTHSLSHSEYLNPCTDNDLNRMIGFCHLLQQAYRRLRTYHLRVGVTFSQGLSSRGPWGRWRRSCLSSQVNSLVSLGLLRVCLTFISLGRSCLLHLPPSISPIWARFQLRAIVEAYLNYSFYSGYIHGWKALISRLTFRKTILERTFILFSIE